MEVGEVEAQGLSPGFAIFNTVVIGVLVRVHTSWGRGPMKPSYQLNVSVAYVAQIVLESGSTCPVMRTS